MHSGQLVADSRRDIRAHVERHWQGKLGIRTTTLPVCQRLPATRAEGLAEFLAFDFNSESWLAPKFEGMEWTFMKQWSCA